MCDSKNLIQIDQCKETLVAIISLHFIIKSNYYYCTNLLSSNQKAAFKMREKKSQNISI